MVEPRVLTVGSAVVDRNYAVTNLPGPDRGAYVRDVEESAGGVAANVATALSRLGHEAGVIARLGDDEDAERVVSDLAGRGIDTRRIRREAGDVTSHCLVFRDPAGERTIVAGGNSVTNLRIRDGDVPHLRDASVVFTSAYVTDPVLSRLAALRRAGGIDLLAFDLAGVFEELEGRGITREGLDDAVSAVDLFVANQPALESYLGSADVDDAVTRLRAAGVARGALTRGSAGSTLFDADGRVDVPARTVDAVDTTGAGDAFTAALIHAWLLRDEPMADAGRFAAAAAALNCTAAGARGNLPTRDAVDALLD